MRTDAIAILATVLMMAAAPIATAQDQPAPPSITQYQNAEQVLDALEDADDEMRTFASGIAFTTMVELGSTITRSTGEIAFAADTNQDGTQRRRFAVHFTDKWTGDRYSDGPETKRTLAFDGRWFWDVFHSERQINKREIVPEGETIDPFELADGPFPPLPIGQQKEDILRRYQVSLVPTTESLEPDPQLDPQYEDEKFEIDLANGLMKFAEGSLQLKLVPKSRAGEARFSEIRLWYKPDEHGRLLPRMSRTVDANSADTSIVQLMHPLKVNDPPREDLLTITPGEGWNVTSTPLPPATPARPTGTTGTNPRGRP